MEYLTLNNGTRMPLVGFGYIWFSDIGQHRTIRQEVSDRIFVPIQSSENGGILYVFPILGTAEVEQKDG